ncbi:MAG: SDR family NAD(P)-dependent oxidoreductase [Gammaproteobacteria bacterium]
MVVAGEHGHQPGRRRRARPDRAETGTGRQLRLQALDRRFPQKRAVVTGGASGLGFAGAGHLAAAGWSIALLDRDVLRLAEAVLELQSKGAVHCEGHAVDITDERAVTAAIDEFVARHGGLDLALNSAGVAVAGDLLETPIADWNWILGINVMGIVHSCRAEVPHMITAGGGLIINVASAASFACGSRMSAYNASKAAVVALSETMFQELAEHGIHVAAAMPGFFRTRLMERARAPEDARGFAVRMMQRSNLEATDVAREILGRAAKGATHIVLPSSYRWLWRYKRLAPRAFLRWMTGMRQQAFARKG